MPVYPTNNHLYSLLWNKYKPALVKLMKDAEKEPQEYQFISHEFKDLNAREKGGHSFLMEAYKGRARNNIKMSIVAQNLMEILQKSNAAQELLDKAMYEFKMDKHFLLTITRHEVETEATDEVEEDKEVKEKEEA